MDETPEDIFGIRDLLDRLGGDMEIIREVVGVFLARSPEVISGLRNSIERDDLEAAARLAHLLKGSAASVGASVIRSKAAEIERLVREGATVDTGKAVERLAREFDVFVSVASRRLQDESAGGKESG